MTREEYFKLKKGDAELKVGCICPHCHHEQISESVDSGYAFEAERCVNCGELFRVNSPTD